MITNPISVGRCEFREMMLIIGTLLPACTERETNYVIIIMLH